MSDTLGLKKGVLRSSGCETAHCLISVLRENAGNRTALEARRQNLAVEADAEDPDPSRCSGSFPTQKPVLLAIAHWFSLRPFFLILEG